MIQFDKNKAIEGHPVITRNGTEIPKLHYIEGIEDGDYCFAGNVLGEVCLWHADGKVVTHFSLPLHPYDLLMKSRKRIMYIAVHRKDNAKGVFPTSAAYTDRKEVERWIDTYGGQYEIVETEIEIL